MRPEALGYVQLCSVLILSAIKRPVLYLSEAGKEPVVSARVVFHVSNSGLHGTRKLVTRLDRVMRYTERFTSQELIE